MNAPVLTRLLAAATLAVASSSALAFSNVFIFGDSLSDSGNIGLAIGAPNGVPQAVTSDFYIPSAPYFPSGTFTNGVNWTTAFAAGLGLASVPSLTPGGGNNFAFGGARVLQDGPPAQGGLPFSLSTQVNQFLAATGGVAPASALYVVAGGGNDARDALASLGPNPSLPQIISTISLAASQYATNTGNIVDALQAAGAQNIIVWNVPNLGVVPAVAGQGANAAFLGTALSQSMNDALAYRMSFETGVVLFDVFSAANQIIANPGAFGFTNVTNACITGICTDPSANFFWDGIHPTAAVHALFAGQMIQIAQAIPEPGTWLLMALGLAGLVGWKRRQG
jgi:outer membrane lipase/esterase